MNTFKNIFRSLIRYKTASALNLLGLSVAFASFMIIMTQVKYDLTFDRHYDNTDRIFRLEQQNEDGFSGWWSRPLGAQILVSPDIEQKGLIVTFSSASIYDTEQGAESSVNNLVDYTAEAGALDVLEFECVHGSPVRFNEPNTVLLSQSVASMLYGNEDPVGRRLIYNNNIGSPVEIIGIYKDFPRNSTVKRHSIVRSVGNENIDSYGSVNYFYYVRLNSAENIGRAGKSVNTELNKFLRSQDESFDSTSARARLNPIGDIHFDNSIYWDIMTEKSNKTTVYSLLSVAFLIIAIAIINFINFATSLVPMRIRSINTQKVIGRTSAAIRRDLIAESVSLAAVSFFAALLIVHVFSGTPLASNISATCDAGADMQIFWGTAIVALITGFAAGLYPAFYSTSFPPALALKGSFGLSSEGRLLRKILISFQYVVSITLIIVALVINSQIQYIRHYDLGFSTENILTTDISAPIWHQRDAFVNKIKSNPAVRDVTFSMSEMVQEGRMSWGGMRFRGKPLNYACLVVASNFPDFMDMKITDGRSFTETDNQKTIHSYIFNETLQKQDSLEVGGRIEGWAGEGEIVGIARDFNFKPLQFGIDPIALILTAKSPEYQTWMLHTYVKVNTPDIPAVTDFIKKTMKEFDPASKADIVFMDEEIGRQYLKERNLSELVILFSLLSVLISIIGVFGLILFETQYRRKEIGVRKVFGATVGEILKMFNKTYVRIVLICFAIAAPIAYFIVKRWLGNFTYRTQIHAWIFGAALVVVLCIVVTVITLRCYKTATDNPIKSIKTE